MLRYGLCYFSKVENNATRRILILEDSVEINDILKEIFAPYHLVYGAFSVAEAKKILVQESIDLLLCDIGLPGINGISFVSEISKDPRYSSIPVIFISGYTSSDVQLNALTSGGIDFISKPFKINELLIKVENLFRVIPQRVPHEMPAGQKPLVRSLVNEVEEILKESYSDVHLDISIFADKLGMSQSTLGRKFYKESGMTLVNYIRYYRLLKAREFLKIGDLRVQEVATLCGFNSVSYFSRAFKNQFQQSPAEFSSGA